MATAELATAAAPLTCQVLASAEELAPWESRWLDLLQRSGSNHVMLSPTWLRAWWEHYGENQQRELRFGLFFEGERLIGLAPLLARRVRHGYCVPFRRLEFLGSDHEQPDGICSNYLNVITEHGAEAAVAQAFARSVIAGSFGHWDELWLPVMDGSGVMPELLMNAFRQAGMQATASPYLEAPVLPLPATWDDYLASLEKKKRYGLTRALRDFEDWSKGDHRFHRVTTTAELAEGQRILESLHGDRWSEGGLFHSARFQAFHRQVMSELLDQGALELQWLEARGEPVAAVYCLTWNGGVTYYQCGRKTDLPRQLRPGTVLLCMTLQHAIAAGLREFDFLPGPVRYKMDFGAVLRPLTQVRVVRPSWRESVRIRVESLLDVARHLRRAWRNRRAARGVKLG